MRRLHWFEFGDQPWFPRVLREAETAYLATAYRLLPSLTQQWTDKIETVLPRNGAADIVDLCSGAGGPMPLVVEELHKRAYDVQAKLTDLYPNRMAGLSPRVAWVDKAVDAAQVLPELTGVRTMFSAFHHFRPTVAHAILRDAFEHRRAIAIFESGSGTPWGVVSMLGVPLAVMAVMPFARPLRWTHLLFTYLLPLTPFIVLWDGLVSMLRIYSPEQLRELTADLQAPDYVWEIGCIHVRGIPDGLPYLVGRPLP